MKNKLRSAASKPIPKIEQSLGYKLGQMYKKKNWLPGGRTDMAWDLAQSQGEIRKEPPFPQWKRKYLKSQAVQKLVWPCDHPSESSQELEHHEFQNTQ